VYTIHFHYDNPDRPRMVLLELAPGYVGVLDLRGTATVFAKGLPGGDSPTQGPSAGTINSPVFGPITVIGGAGLSKSGIPGVVGLALFPAQGGTPSPPGILAQLGVTCVNIDFVRHVVTLTNSVLKSTSIEVPCYTHGQYAYSAHALSYTDTTPLGSESGVCRFRTIVFYDKVGKTRVLKDTGDGVVTYTTESGAVERAPFGAITAIYDTMTPNAIYTNTKTTTAGRPSNDPNFLVDKLELYAGSYGDGRGLLPMASISAAGADLPRVGAPTPGSMDADTTFNIGLQVLRHSTVAYSILGRALLNVVAVADPIDGIPTNGHI